MCQQALVSSTAVTAAGRQGLRDEALRDEVLQVLQAGALQDLLMKVGVQAQRARQEREGLAWQGSSGRKDCPG